MSEYEKMRMRAIEALIYQGIRVPTDRQIAVWILTKKEVLYELQDRGYNCNLKNLEELNNG